MVEIKTTMKPSDRITVSAETESGLRCSEWDFIKRGGTLRCYGYREMSRPTKRHKFRIERECGPSYFDGTTQVRPGGFQNARIVPKSDGMAAVAKEGLIDSILALRVEWPDEAIND